MPHSERLFWRRLPSVQDSSSPTAPPPVRAASSTTVRTCFRRLRSRYKAAIEAAQTAADGEIGEVDLEDYNGTLVFNVDVGDVDVKVDAATGEVLGMGDD